VKQEQEPRLAGPHSVSLESEITRNSRRHHVESCPRQAKSMTRICPGAANSLVAESGLEDIDNFRHRDKLLDFRFLDVQHGWLPSAMVISFVRYTSWIALSSATPSCIGRWKAFRPEISPMPPARLLMTAVLTASFKSLSPAEAPPELIKPARPI